MARIRLEQILSNLSYDSINNKLTVSGSRFPALVVSGSVLVTSSITDTGSITIEGIDSWGDSGSFWQVDLGEY